MGTEIRIEDIDKMTRPEIIYALARYAHPQWYKKQLGKDMEFLREFLRTYVENEIESARRDSQLVQKAVA